MLRHLISLATYRIVSHNPQKHRDLLLHLDPSKLRLQRGTPISTGRMIRGTRARIALDASTAQAA